MKKIFIVMAIIGTICILLRINNQFNSSFATEIALKYVYETQDIHIKVEDQQDIDELKSILNGFVYSDTPSCGFSEDISIILTDAKETVILCPALDGHSIIRIGSSDRYFKVSDENRERLDQILSKHGMKFPSL